MTNLPIMPSVAVPKGQVFIGAPGATMMTGPLRFHRDPWPSAPHGFSEAARDARTKALDWLAAKLDAAYASYGWDPEKWRREKEIEEMERTNMFRVVASERVAMGVVSPDSWRHIGSTV